MSTARVVILFHITTVPHLLSDCFGKCFECTLPDTISCEVWFCYSLSSWMPPFPEVACISLWRCACRWFRWRGLFKASLCSFVGIVRRSSLRSSVPCMLSGSLRLVVLGIYTSFIFLWWTVSVAVCTLMASSSPPNSHKPAHNNDLASPNQDSHIRLNLQGVETPRSHKPSSSTPTTFSDALILGMGEQGSNPNTSTEPPPILHQLVCTPYVCWENLGVSLCLCP